MQHTIEVPIAKELHRFIIGKEGKTLKDLEASTGTSIRVPGSADAKTTVSVTGISENIRKAADQMQVCFSCHGCLLIQVFHIITFHSHLSPPSL